MFAYRRHIFFWISYLTFLWIYAAVKSNNTADFVTFLCKQFINICIFYYSVFIFWGSYFRRKYLVAILLFFTGMFSYFIIRYLVEYYFLPSLGKPIFDPFVKRRFFTDHTFGYFNYSVYGLLYVFSSRAVKSQRDLLQSEKDKFALQKKNIELQTEKLLLQSQNLQLQNEKLKIQYDFLKAQINPHFLYNTLSFFYSKTLISDKETAEGIALLTDIMRYSLQQGEMDGKVELDDEVAHLNNYIRLQQMRFNNTLNIQFTNETEPESYRIVPHIFITLVENAFKHGVANNPLYPLQVRLYQKDGNIIFEVQNKISYGSKDNSGIGVGLQNIRSRLLMEYGDAAGLENRVKDDFFTVHLSIPIILLEKKNNIPEIKKQDHHISVTA